MLKNVAKIGAVLLSVVTLATGCDSLVKDDKTKCFTFETTKQIVETTEKSYAEKYTAEELQKQYDMGLLDLYSTSFWKGFWRDHYDCETCIENGDVPEEYKDGVPEEEEAVSVEKK